MTPVYDKLIARAMTLAAKKEYYFSRGAADAFLDALFQAMSERFARGECVRCERLGAVCVHETKARQMKQPRTGRIYSIRHRRHLSFSISMWMRSRINARER